MKSINLFVLWKTQNSFAISYNVTISAFDGTESQSNVEQNQHFGAKSSTQLQRFERLQQQAMDSAFSLPLLIRLNRLRKIINCFQKPQFTASAYFKQLEH